MLRLPITKDGNIRYLELIKYSILIGLLIVGYTTVINVGFIPVLLGGLQLSSLFVVVFIFNVAIVAFLEVARLLRSVVKPVITYIKTKLLLPIETIIVPLVSSTFVENNSQQRLNVFRC